MITTIIAVIVIIALISGKVVVDSFCEVENKNSKNVISNNSGPVDIGTTENIINKNL